MPSPLLSLCTAILEEDRAAVAALLKSEVRLAWKRAGGQDRYEAEIAQ